MKNLYKSILIYGLPGSGKNTVYKVLSASKLSTLCVNRKGF